MNKRKHRRNAGGGQDTKISTSLSESDALRWRPASLAAASLWRASCRDRLDSSDFVDLTVGGVCDGRAVRGVILPFVPVSATTHHSFVSDIISSSSNNYYNNIYSLKVL